MNNDLISRSALIKALNEAQIEFDKYYKGLGKAKVITDNAPTIEQEVYITGTDYDFYIRGYKEGRKDFERPKGEWIEVKDAFGWATYYHWDCPFCKTKCGKISNFCPECGADMRGEKNE